MEKQVTMIYIFKSHALQIRGGPPHFVPALISGSGATVGQRTVP